MSDPDYDNLSVEELQKIARGDSDPEFDSMSEEELKKIANPPGMVESGLRGLAQGASLGFADEIAGGAEALFTDKPYEQARDESRANFKRAKDANPVTYGAGELGGGVATALVPGLNAVKGVKGAMGLGAAMGTLAGAGASEADNAADVALDAGKGMALGAGAGALGYGASKAIPWAAKTAGEKLKAIAEMRAVKSLGGSKRMMENLKGVPGAEQRLGRELLDEGVVSPLASKDKMAERLTNLTGKRIGELTGKIDEISQAQGLGPEDMLRLEAAKFSPQEAAQALKDKMAVDYGHIPQKIRDKQGEVVDEWLSQPGRMDIKDAQAFKTQMQKWIKDPSYQNANPGVAQETLKGVRNQIKTGIERNADEFANIAGGQAGEIKNINQSLGGLFQADDMLEDAIARGSKNQTFSLGDKISAGVGAAADGGISAVATGVANKLLREKGSQLAATGADAVSKMLLKSPKMQMLANTNPPAFKALAQSVAQRVASQAPKQVAGPEVDEKAKQAFIEGN